MTRDGRFDLQVAARAVVSQGGSEAKSGASHRRFKLPSRVGPRATSIARPACFRLREHGSDLAHYLILVIEARSGMVTDRSRLYATPGTLRPGSAVRNRSAHD